LRSFVQFKGHSILSFDEAVFKLGEFKLILIRTLGAQVSDGGRSFALETHGHGLRLPRGFCKFEFLPELEVVVAVVAHLVLALRPLGLQARQVE